MAELAALSVEFAHVYLKNLTETSLEETVEASEAVVRPLVDGLRAAGKTVSTVVMIDDYFERDRDAVAAKRQMIKDACAAAGIEPDWFASEAAAAASVEDFLPALMLPPEHGDGSAHPPRRSRSTWLSNGQPPRLARDPAGDDPALDLLAVPGAKRGAGGTSPGRAPSRVVPANHSIHLDVELQRDTSGAARGDVLYSCPLLAAWWQLLRLGVASPARGLLERCHKGAAPFPAERTLTLLHPRLIEVEHAVRVILEHVVPPEPWRRNMRTHGNAPVGLDYLDRIAYCFVPDGFATGLVG